MQIGQYGPFSYCDECDDNARTSNDDDNDRANLAPLITLLSLISDYEFHTVCLTLEEISEDSFHFDIMDKLAQKCRNFTLIMDTYRNNHDL